MNKNRQQIKLDPAVKQEAVYDFNKRYEDELSQLQQYLTDILICEDLTNPVPHSISVFIVPQMQYPVHCNVFTIFFSDTSMPRVTINFGHPLTEQYTCSIFKGESKTSDLEHFIDFGSKELTKNAINEVGDCIINNILIASSIARMNSGRSSAFSSNEGDNIHVRKYDIENDEIVTEQRGIISTKFTVKTIGNKIVLMIKSVHDIHFIESLGAVINYVKHNFDTMPLLSFNIETHAELSKLTELRLKPLHDDLVVKREGTLFSFEPATK